MSKVDPLATPLRAPAEVWAGFGRTVVVAPHPDDETLGCGGLLALAGPGLARVVVVSDGAASHPGSRLFPSAARRDLREGETLAALAALGFANPAASTVFLRLPDGALPRAPEAPGFATATDALLRAWEDFSPQTVLAPWRRDPHPDHRAVAALIGEARTRLGGRAPRLVEYPVWLWERAGIGDAPDTGEVSAWRLDISAALAQKATAVAAHRSQLGQVIVDDPAGFCLTPGMLAHFARPWELYLETLVA